MAELRATPQSPVLGTIANFLRQASAPQRSQQMQGIAEFLGLPGAAREIENWSYGNYPMRINPNAGRTASYIPEVKPGRKQDLADTLLLGADIVAPVVAPARRAVGTLARAGEQLAERAVPQVMERGGTGAEMLAALTQGSTSNVVKPVGNINLQPVLRAEAFRGPDVQPIEAFIAQSKSMPGVTKDAFEELVSRYSDVTPGTKISKTDFEARIPPSEFNKVDLHAGTATSAEDDLLEQAYDMVNEDAFNVFEMVFDTLGVPRREIPEGQYVDFVDSLQRYHVGDIGPEDLPAPVRQAMERNGLLEDRSGFEDLVQENLDTVVRETAQNMRQNYEEPIGAGGYRFTDYQRLLPDDVRSALDEQNYFELGVTHPDKAGVSYRHYPSYEGREDGLIGHVRGTMIPADVTDAIAYAPGAAPGRERAIIPLKPNSVIIEEIQSDAQKGAFSAEQTGALRQVHGTLFKAAINDALEKGATTVYYPTARTIALVRGGNPKPYASIYDQQIMREGLKPLAKVPGVEIKPIESMMFVSPGETPKPVVAYYEINFSPEATEFILKGPGQTTPGYAAGGVVKSIRRLLEKYLAKEAPEAVAEAAPKEQKMLMGVYRGYAGEPGGEEALFASPQRSIADYYARRRAAETGATPHAEMLMVDPFAGNQYGLSIPLDKYNRDINFTRARKLKPEDVKDRKQLYAEGGAVNYDPDEIAQIAERATQGFAAGGLVDYDPNEIGTIVSQLKEEFNV